MTEDLRDAVGRKDVRAAVPRALSSAELHAVRPMLLAFARRAVRAADIAEDLVQETLLAAVAPESNFDGRSSLRTWLTAIVSHKIMDHFRRCGRRIAFEADVDTADLTAPATTSSPERTLAHREALSILERGLAALPELERMAVLLIDVEGVDHAEGCNALAVQATHLRVLLHRGRHRLRKALEHAVM